MSPASSTGPLVAVADPAFDLGNTVALLTLAPGPAGPLAVRIRRSTARRYLETYRRRREVDPRAVEYYEAYRVLRALVWAGETRQAAAGVIEDPGPGPWHAVRTVAGLTTRFEQVSGLLPELPPA